MNLCLSPLPCNQLALLLEVAARHQGSNLDRLLAPEAGPPEHEILLGAAWKRS